LIQRNQIEALIKDGIKQEMIVTNIGVDSFTLNREFFRKIDKRRRTACDNVATNAQRKKDHRHFNKHKIVKFSANTKQQANRCISEEKWSPKIIIVEGKKPVNVE
jgi:IS30 family transposase